MSGHNRLPFVSAIKKVLRFIDEQLPRAGTRVPAEAAAELRAACEEALEALADLRTDAR